MLRPSTAGDAATTQASATGTFGPRTTPRENARDARAEVQALHNASLTPRTLCVCDKIRRLWISLRHSLESSTPHGTKTLPSFTGDRSTGRRRALAAPAVLGPEASVFTVVGRRTGRSGTSRTVVRSLGRTSDFRGHQSLFQLLRFGARPLDRLRSDRQRPNVPYVLNGSTVGTTTNSRIKLTCLTTV